jgi:hypothetical protein
VSVRHYGLIWALVCSPIIGWIAAWSGNGLTHGRLGVTGAFVLLALLPAAVAGAGNALLGRDRRAAVVAGVLAGFVCYGGFLLLVLLFFLTVPDEFFTMSLRSRARTP